MRSIREFVRIILEDGTLKTVKMGSLSEVNRGYLEQRLTRADCEKLFGGVILMNKIDEEKGCFGSEGKAGMD